MEHFLSNLGQTIGANPWMAVVAVFLGGMLLLPGDRGVSARITGTHAARRRIAPRHPSAGPVAWPGCHGGSRGGSLLEGDGGVSAAHVAGAPPRGRAQRMTRLVPVGKRSEIKPGGVPAPPRRTARHWETA